MFGLLSNGIHLEKTNHKCFFYLLYHVLSPLSPLSPLSEQYQIIPPGRLVSTIKEKIPWVRDRRFARSQDVTKSLQAAQREIELRVKLKKLATDVSGNLSWTEWGI